MKINGRSLKRLSIRHIVILQEYGYEIKDFLFIAEDPESYTFYSKSKGKVVTLRR